MSHWTCSVIPQVSATDRDDGENGRVRYSIVQGDSNRDFSISEDTGVLRVAKNLNYERVERYRLTVKGEDCAGGGGSGPGGTGPGPGPSRSDLTTVEIAVSDINDNPPTFLDSPYLAYVVEGVVPPDGYVLTVSAHDADTKPFNGQVRYFLKEGDADLFRINASTGEVSLLKPLDREHQPEYQLTLVAMDTGESLFTSFALFHLPSRVNE